MNENFEKMCRRTGGYSLPWLIHIYDDDINVNFYFINDVSDLSYNGKVYKASTFSYTPNEFTDGFSGGGSLEIEAVDVNAGNMVIDALESYRSVRLDVIGILLQTGDISEIKSFQNHYGSVTWTGKQITFSFDTDDRLSMTFPALIFNASNNRGNA